MINRRTIFDHDDEAGGAAAVSALRFIRPSFRIEDAARMHGLSHRDGHLAIGDLDFSAGLHDEIAGLLGGKIDELHEIARDSGLAMSAAPVFLAISTASRSE